MQMYLLVQFNIFQHFYGLIIVTKKGMESQESHQTEVTEHFVQRMSSKISCYRIRITTTSIYLKQNMIHLFTKWLTSLLSLSYLEAIQNFTTLRSSIAHPLTRKEQYTIYITLCLKHLWRCHTLSRQHYRRKVLSVQWGLTRGIPRDYLQVERFNTNLHKSITYLYL